MLWKVSRLEDHWGLFKSVPKDLLYDIKIFHVFPIFDGYMTSSLSAIFITKSDIAYAIGRNRWMMLGPSYKVCSNPKQIRELSCKFVKTIDTGLMHGLALTEDGLVYEWGLDVDLPYSEPFSIVPPRKVDWLSHNIILQIACGSYFNLALSENNSIFYWGYYDMTQNPMQRIISILGEPSIVSLSSGLLFSAAVGSSGKVYTWTGPKREAWKCSPGMSAFTVTTEIREVPLGRSVSRKERPMEAKPIKIPTDLVSGRPIKVVCAMRSIYILMESGLAFVSGYVPRSIQLTNANKVSFCDTILGLSFPGYPVDIVCSKWSDYLVVECIDSKKYHLFSDVPGAPQTISTLCEAFSEMPTPQISTSLIYESLDEEVYIPPRLKINEELFCSDSLSDVQIILADNQKIPAHKYVLLGYSQHFRNMYEGNWMETKSNVIDASKYNPIAYKAYLNYLYNGKLEKLATVDLLEMYHLADEYMEKPLTHSTRRSQTGPLRQPTNFCILNFMFWWLFMLKNDYDAFNV